MASDDEAHGDESLNYPDMIMTAIDELTQVNGVTETAISSHIVSTHSDLPETHSALVSQHLDSLTSSGQLVCNNNSYKKAEAEADSAVKRGRGRPPKSKSSTPSTPSSVGAKRGRGRPPKVNTPSKTPPSSASVTALGAKRSAGRPPKVKSPAEAKSSPASASPARSRGRPRKVETTYSGKPRGRPPKVLKTEETEPETKKAFQQSQCYGDLKREKIIIDTDPGMDDSIAIFIAFQTPELEILGLTTEDATTNALLLCEIAGQPDIPVAEGSPEPLKCEIAGRPDIPVAEGSPEPLKEGAPRIADFIHGSDGLGNAFLPLPITKKSDRNAAEFLVNTVSAHPGEVSILALENLPKVFTAH